MCSVNSSTFPSGREERRLWCWYQWWGFHTPSGGGEGDPDAVCVIAAVVIPAWLTEEERENFRRVPLGARP